MRFHPLAVNHIKVPPWLDPPRPLQQAESEHCSGPGLNRWRWRQLATAAAFLNSSDKPSGGKLRKPSAVVREAKAWLAARLLSSAFCNALPFYLTACIMSLTLCYLHLTFNPFFSGPSTFLCNSVFPWVCNIFSPNHNWLTFNTAEQRI